MAKYKYALLGATEWPDEFEVVESLDSHSYDPSVLWMGARYPAAEVTEPLVTVSHGKAAPYLENPMSWTIMSQECVRCFAELIEPHVQVINCPVRLPDGEVRRDRYFVLNPLVVADAIHTVGTRKRNATLLNMGLRAERIDPAVGMFRLKYQEFRVVFAPFVIERIASKFRGKLSSIPLPLVSAS